MVAEQPLVSDMSKKSERFRHMPFALLRLGGLLRFGFGLSSCTTLNHRSNASMNRAYRPLASHRH